MAYGTTRPAQAPAWSPRQGLNRPGYNLSAFSAR